MGARQGWIFVFFLGGTGGGSKVTNFEKYFDKKQVRIWSYIELSLRLSCTEFRALSSGHGPRGLGFEGGGQRRRGGCCNGDSNDDIFLQEDPTSTITTLRFSWVVAT